MGPSGNQRLSAGAHVPKPGKRPILAVLALILLTVAAYSPVIDNGFVSWDDDDYIRTNVNLRDGLTWDSVRWAFGARIFGNWHPLTWISHLIDVSLFGLNPAGHHLMSVALHVATSLLLFATLRALTGAFAPSLAVAAFFALHPLHVESVAWASERKDVLSALFWTLSLRVYAAYVRRPAAVRYLSLVALFAAGLMAKQMLVTMPLVLLLLDWWPLGRIAGTGGRGGGSGSTPLWRVLLEKAPLFLLAAASGWVTFVVQQAAVPLSPHETVPLAGRLANALHSYLAYAVQMVLPLNLSALYRQPENGFSPAVLGAAVIFLGGATAIAFAGARRAPYLMAGWLWYLATLLPVIGIVQFSLQARADRYTYLPLTGLFLAAAWGGATLAGKGPRARIAVGVAAVAALLPLIGLTFRQVEVWRSSTSLFSNAVRQDRGNWQAWNYLGQALWAEGRVQEAVADYREALRLRPDFAEARFNLSFALAQLGQSDEASDLFRESSAADPNLRADLYYQTGLVMLGQGDRAAAVSSLREALRIKPDFPEAEAALQKILAGGGR